MANRQVGVFVNVKKSALRRAAVLDCQRKSAWRDRGTNVRGQGNVFKLYSRYV